MNNAEQKWTPYSYLVAQHHDRYITVLDPLSADQFFIEYLPRINKMGLTTELVEAGNKYLSDIKNLSEFGPAHMKAILRDLGFIAASLVTHGLSLSTVPKLEPILLILSEILDEVPRDTVTTYGTRNPLDHRMRTFTGIAEERLFIQAVVDTMDILPACLSALDGAQQEDPCSASFLGNVLEATHYLHIMVQSITTVKRKITPEVFSYQLRPFFPPFTIGGKEYFGPGGAQMALIIVDIMIFGSDILASNKEYKAYVEDNQQYLPPEYRGYLSQIMTRPSLVGHVRKKFREVQDDSRKHQSFLKSVASLLNLLQVLLKFRFPHKKLAEDNMQVRLPDSVGSGGYSVAILDILVRITETAFAETNQIYQLFERRVQQ